MPKGHLAVLAIFSYGTIGSPKNSITMMVICHINVYVFTSITALFAGALDVQGQGQGTWPSFQHDMYRSVRLLVDGIRSTWASFMLHVIGSTATALRKVSEATKEMKLHDSDVARSASCVSDSLKSERTHCGPSMCFPGTQAWFARHLINDLLHHSVWILPCLQ